MLLLSVSLWSSGADAQGGAAATADSLFRDARALMKRGEFAQACPKLAESQRLDRAAGTAVNLSDCWAKLGRHADSLAALREALDLMTPGDTRIAPVKEQIAALDKRVPRLTIRRAPDAPAGLELQLDEISLGAGSLGSALPVNPGEHVVVARAPGWSEKKYSVSLAESESRVIDVTAGPKLSEEPSPSATPMPAKPVAHAATPVTQERPGSAQRTWGWVALGVGAVGLAVGGVEYVQWKAADDDVKKNCKQSGGVFACGDLKTAQERQDAANRDALVSNIAFGLGAAGILGGIVLLATAPSDTSGARREVGVVPSINAHGGAVMAVGRW